jgi:hypothetical protein
MQNMNAILKRSCPYGDMIGPQVHEGHYDLAGPSNEFILPPRMGERNTTGLESKNAYVG